MVCALGAIVPRLPHLIVGAVVDLPRRLGIELRSGDGLRRNVGQPLSQQHRAAEPSGESAVGDKGRVRKAQCSRGDTRRKYPGGVLVFPHLLARHVFPNDPAGGGPLRIIGEIARVSSLWLEEAERAASADCDRTHGDGRLESNS